jgi:hypothetical protein
VFLKRRTTSRFSNKKVEWRRVGSRVHIADSAEVNSIFGTFVGNSFLVSVSCEQEAIGRDECGGQCELE